MENKESEIINLIMTSLNNADKKEDSQIFIENLLCNIEGVENEKS